MKVVIVDDSALDRKLCRTLLEEVHGPRLEYLEAESGVAGLEICRVSHPDCVLVDYRLPNMSGLEFLARLVAEEPGAAVVMLTGLDSGEVAAEALKAGAHDFLLKDHITGETLHLAIQKAIQKLNLTRTLAAERERLATSLAEKEVLLQEVHHRVKNNLQVIASLLQLQANATADETLTLALRESQHRVESMALVHEQLYETEGLREVDLAKHASLLAANLFQSYGIDPARITCRMAVEPLVMGFDRAIPRGLILNEFISNRLRHGFPEGRSGSVQITGGRRDGQVTLEVRDNGVGIPEGVEGRKTKSLGLQIVNILTRQLKGTFEFEHDCGARFRLSFPEERHGRPWPPRSDQQSLPRPSVVARVPQGKGSSESYATDEILPSAGGGR